MSKRHIFLLLITVLVTACNAPRENPGVTPPASRTPIAATAIPTVIPFTPTPEKVFVPKQNDLIFIEFFAVT
jgi:hypothetical protein